MTEKKKGKSLSFRRTSSTEGRNLIVLAEALSSFIVSTIKLERP